MKTTETGYQCQKEWPEGCFVQSGESGIVLPRSGKAPYSTAFFEAFPKSPSCFIRGEGASVAEAEAKAYRTLHKYLKCNHQYTRLSDDGYAQCNVCGMKANALPNLTTCHQCGQQGADHDHPRNLRTDDGKPAKLCTPCITEVVYPDFIYTPVSEMTPEGLSEDREAAEDFYSDTFIQKVYALLFLDLHKHEDFIPLSGDEQKSLLNNLRMHAYSFTLKIRSQIIKILLSNHPEGTQYLDEAAFYEICCTDGCVGRAAIFVQRAWELSLDPESRAMDDRADEAAHTFANVLAHKLMSTVEEWERTPPENADIRRRIETDEEMEKRLSNLCAAFERSSQGSAPEKD